MKRSDKIINYAIILFTISLMVFEIAALFLWVSGTLTQKCAALFTIVGIYGFAIAFLSKNKTLQKKRFDLLSGLTSISIREYIGSNWQLAGLLGMINNLSRHTSKKNGYSRFLDILGKLESIILIPAVGIYMIFHICVVVPLTYLPVIGVSAIVHNIKYSTITSDFSSNDSYESKAVRYVLNVSDPVNEISLKGFLIGIPALILSLYSSIAGLFIS